MSTDASKLTLEIIGNKIRPQIVNLSFRRLRNYCIDLDLKDIVHGIQYHLKLWDGNTRGPMSMERDWKAYALPIARRIILVHGSTKPKRIEYDRLIILCPHNDCVLWAFQELKFIPERNTSIHFQGMSEIWAVNDQNLRGVARPAVDFWEKVCGGLKDWVADTIESKGKGKTKLEQFQTDCIIQWAGPAADGIIRKTAGIRKAFAAQRP